MAIVDRRRRRRRYITQPRPEINYQELYIFLTMQRRPRLLARKRFILHTHVTVCVCVSAVALVWRVHAILYARSSRRDVLRQRKTCAILPWQQPPKEAR